jgi:thiamine biosynthesis lipoprotein
MGRIKYYNCFSGLFILLNIWGCHESGQQRENTILGLTMGTTYRIKIARESMAERDLTALKQKIDSVLVEVNRQMSAFDPQSELSSFNASNDTTPFPVSDPLRYVIQIALEVNKQSNGYFDVTVAPLVNLWGFGKKGSRSDPPSPQQVETVRKRTGSVHLKVVDGMYLKKTIPELELDLSAIAKGYGVDAVAGLLDSLGYKNYLVEIGGEIVVRGVKTDAGLWKVAIDRPQYASLPGDAVMEILALKDVAVATSGDYRNYFEYRGRKYSHTIDPFTGFPVQHDLASVTIIAGKCTRADALATAVMAMGAEKGLPWIESLSAVEALLIIRLPDGKYQEKQTPGFGKYLTEQQHEQNH